MRMTSACQCGQIFEGGILRYLIHILGAIFLRSTRSELLREDVLSISDHLRRRGSGLFQDLLNHVGELDRLYHY